MTSANRHNDPLRWGTDMDKGIPPSPLALLRRSVRWLIRPRNADWTEQTERLHELAQEDGRQPHQLLRDMLDVYQDGRT